MCAMQAQQAVGNEGRRHAVSWACRVQRVADSHGCRVLVRVHDDLASCQTASVNESYVAKLPTIVVDGGVDHAVDDRVRQVS